MLHCFVASPPIKPTAFDECARLLWPPLSSDRFAPLKGWSRSALCGALVCSLLAAMFLFSIPILPETYSVKMSAIAFPPNPAKL